MLIGELFGTSDHHKFVKSISSSGKFIYIDFYKYYYGVEFVASIKYNKIIPDCQSWLDDNILMSPNNSNINCSWIITREFGSYITLYFNYIEVKPWILLIKNLLTIVSPLEGALLIEDTS